jgi:hypothetical protein
MQNEIIAEEVSEIGLDDPTIEVQPAVKVSHCKLTEI